MIKTQNAPNLFEGWPNFNEFCMDCQPHTFTCWVSHKSQVLRSLKVETTESLTTGFLENKVMQPGLLPYKRWFCGFEVH